MKGYIVDGKAYIFPQTAAEIPEVEADLFYVQEENFTEWVAENESIADKLVKYNYNLMSVQPKVWAGHTNDDLAITYDITLSGAQDLIQNLSLNKSVAAEDESITITPGGSSYTAQWVNVTSTDAQITWDNSNTLWSFTMPATDVTATATTRTLYHVSKAGDYQTDFSIQPNSYMPQHQYQYDSYVNLVPAAGINPTDGYTMTVQTDEATPSPVSASWDSVNSYWYFAMPSSDVVANLSYESQATSYTFTIDEDGTTINAGSYEEGDNVQYTFDHALEQDQPGIWHWEYTMSPASLVDYNFSPGTPARTDNIDPENPVEWPEEPALITFTMPADDVLYTITKVYDDPEQPE